jgi:2-amino-4-hydroxy-6-hydroxymethyldihydropteridine diphosphokinase
MEMGLSLGSNVGDRLRNLQLARDSIAKLQGVEIAAQSPVYETEPVDVQPEHRDKRFLNAVLILETGADPKVLQRQFYAIEIRLGRRRTADRHAPRSMDIDILFAGQARASAGRLTLPHPRWNERRFVVQPLADVRRELVLPGEARPVGEVLAALPAKPKVRLFSHQW